MLKCAVQTALLVLVLFFSSRTSFAQDSGADVFKTNCQVCHGADGMGNTPMGKALKIVSYKDPAVTKSSNAALETTIKNGKDKMPAFNGKLSDAQIHAVVEYIRTLEK